MDLSKEEKDMTISLGKIKIDPRKRLDLLSDFSGMMEKFREAQKKREREWLDDYYQAFGFGHGDVWDDEDYWDDCYPVVHTPGGRYNGVTMKPQRFMNGMEVDDDWDPVHGTQRKKGHRSGKSGRTRYMGGTVDRTYQDGYDDDWGFNDENDDSLFTGGNDLDIEALKNAHKKIVFYRKLNNTADTYEWDNIYEFSEWLEEEGITISPLDAEDVVYQDEIHCCLDPTTTSKKLVCALNYEDLVYVVTGGDVDYLNEAVLSTPLV